MKKVKNIFKNRNIIILSFIVTIFLFAQEACASTNFRFTPELDHKLIQAYGESSEKGRWMQIAKKISSGDVIINPLQCRKRYVEYLDPMIKKEPATEAEKKLLREAVRQYGIEFSKISREIFTDPSGTHRTRTFLKSLYYSSSFKDFRLKEITRVMPKKREIKISKKLKNDDTILFSKPRKRLRTKDTAKKKMGHFVIIDDDHTPEPEPEEFTTAEHEMGEEDSFDDDGTFPQLGNHFPSILDGDFVNLCQKQDDALEKPKLEDFLNSLEIQEKKLQMSYGIYTPPLPDELDIESYPTSSS
jgi:hypothetical protein